jgi:Putative metallopeptidase
MSNRIWQASVAGTMILFTVIKPDWVLAQSKTSSTTIGQTNRVSIEYVPPETPTFQDLYDFLRQHQALERIQEILSPLRAPEELIVKTRECRAINSWYRRESLGPTVTICYEYLKHILESLPNENNPAGVTPADAAVGQFLWVTLHEVGHATFDILNVPIFGHPEDAADDFATYIMLQFGQEQAHRLIEGAAWAWRAYLGDYKKNPVVPLRLSSFASDHGLPQERFYNLICLAFGANQAVFADLEQYLPPERSQRCSVEYVTLRLAFEKEITPHIDQQMATRVLDTNWLLRLESEPGPQK